MVSVNVFREMDFLRLPFVESVGLNVATSGGDARTGLSALLIVVLTTRAIALLVGIIFIYRHTIGRRQRTTLMEDYTREAEECEKAGEFSWAGRNL